MAEQSVSGRSKKMKAPNLSPQMKETIDSWRQSLPKERVPRIMICGATGRGKTTTINTLFGREVGKVGTFARGTKEDAVYEWVSKGANIDLVDVPGLGDAKYDREFAAIYRNRVPLIDAFLVVTVPPRPIDLGTIRTIRLLRNQRVPISKITIGINRLDVIHSDGHNVRLDGIAGPRTERDVALIEEQRSSAIESLLEDGRIRIPDHQVIPYDALSGWNMYPLLEAVLENLPIETLPAWQRQVEKGARDLQNETRRQNRKEWARLQAEKQQLAEEVARLQAENVAALNREKNARRRAARQLREQKRRQEAEEDVRRARIQSIEDSERRQHEDAESRRIAEVRAKKEEARRRASEDEADALREQLLEAIGALRDTQWRDQDEAAAKLARKLEKRAEKTRNEESEMALSDLRSLRIQLEEERVKLKQELLRQQEEEVQRKEMALREQQEKRDKHDQKVASRTGKLLVALIGHGHTVAIMGAASKGIGFVKRLFGRK